MSFNIKTFSSKLSKYGLAKSNLFIVEVGIPSSIRAELQNITVVKDDLRFFCRSVTLPEMDLITTDIQMQGFGALARRPQGMNFPIIPAVFMIDSEFGVMKYFHRWMQAIINYDTSSGVRGVVNNQLPFEMGYKKEYETTMKITVYSFGDGRGRKDNTVYIYNLTGVYPVNVGNVVEDWESHSDVMVLPVGFTYDTLQISAGRQIQSFDGNFGIDGTFDGRGGDIGVANNGSFDGRGGYSAGPNNGTFDGRGGARMSSSNGLLSWFSSINGTAEAIKGVTRPRNIQDAINQITNISTITRALR
jgi:hypothetical protein